MSELRIGAVAGRTGTNTPTIRYYESIGLLPVPARRASGQRAYTPEDIQRLVFVRRCREFGFTIGQVRTFIDMQADPSRSCLEIRDIAEAHLQTIRQKLSELRALERSMAAFAAACTDQCNGGPSSTCVPLVALAEAR